MHVFFLSEGIGFNTDVFETNVLNLAVVLYLVFTAGSDALSQALERRRERVITRVTSAEEKYNAAQKVLQKAQIRLDDAKLRAESIRSEGNKTAYQVTNFVALQSQDELARLEELQISTLAVAEQKATNQIQTQLVTLALAKASKKVSSRLASQGTQKAFVDLQIKTLRPKA
jgi:F-type H+-transporting ATPase subunit b